jgi:methyl-accepting chemotaxis protein
MRIIYRAAGWILIVGALGGIVFGVAGLYVYWQFQSDVFSQITSNLDLISQTVNTTSDALSVVNTTLDQTTNDLSMMSDFTDNVGTTIGDARPTLNTTADLVDTSLVNIIANTQTSLAAAETSAQFVDDTLSIITAIPFIGGRYNPPTSLSASIGNISKSLDGLPDSLSQIGEGLRSASSDLGDVQINVDDLSSSIALFQENLDQASSIISEYQGITTNLNTKLTTLQNNLPGWFDRINIGVSGVLSWLILASVGMFFSGLMLNSWQKRWE